MKKDKKKVLVLAFLLLVAISVVGYGAYSYYYTEGSVESEEASSEDSDNVIRITGSFNPTVEGDSSNSGESTFLGNGGTITLECPESTGGHETITCTGNVRVSNEGSTAIRVEYSSGSAYAQSYDATVSTDEPYFYWSNPDDYYGSSYTYISAGSSETLNVSLDVNVGGSSSISSSEAQLVTEPVASGSLTAYVSVSLEATQVH